MKRFLLNLWMLPIAILVWVFYLWPFTALGLLVRGTVVNGVQVFSVWPKWGWWARLWDGWGGHSLPGAVVLMSRDHLLHELRHQPQWEALGPLFPLVYALLLWRYGYEDNPLEVEARHVQYR